MKRTLLALTLALGFLATAAPPAHASWVGDNCYNYTYAESELKRSEARAYAEIARNEGYEYGGGCWNTNDRDDTPGQPDSLGEGPDCSGFTFKTWELRSTEGAHGFRWWSRIENMHGPYGSWDFWDPVSGWPFYNISKARTATVWMDAFARNGHVGILYTNTGPSDGTDYIIEAACDACGTGVFTETFRYDSRYTGVRRENWTAECSPQCGSAPDALPPVVKL